MLVTVGLPEDRGKKEEVRRKGKGTRKTGLTTQGRYAP